MRLSEDRSKATDILSEIRWTIVSKPLLARQEIRVSDLAVELGSSTTPVREALSQLVGEGLVELVPHKGFYQMAVNLKSTKSSYGLLEAIVHHKLKASTSVKEYHVEALESWAQSSFATVARAGAVMEFYGALLSHPCDLEAKRVVSALCLKTNFVRERILSENRLWERSVQCSKSVVEAVQNEKWNAASQAFRKFSKLKKAQIEPVFNSFALSFLTDR
ncbi:GntR family transcriptional regulator [Ensifer sp. ENS06]|uniref:GntR family transcriptional regulator n=1 Tax=Ensifer sp. ENS06 TaxID=2769276 RepID=UPI0017876C6E|nr:GntR family transcriptional regulator [Ensifer sp. ENS06]MBD9627008.1 GntR family transcriptional regulator [Ensifer sp. ENS06]